MTEPKSTGLALLRQPFLAHHISKLPKPTRAQTDEVKADYKKGVRCEVCGSWHHPKVVHLDYVGHAALTDRLLDADINWSWEPLALSDKGLPVIDQDGGLWIKLTVAGQTRLGYGDAQGKSGGDAMKERIGDALRNAAMRFGAALDLWHKGDLHLDEPEAPKPVSAKSITQDVLSKMPPNEVEFLQEIAADTVALLDEGRDAEAQAFITNKNMDAEEKIALWAMFNSKQRSALKAKPTAEEFANTP